MKIVNRVRAAFLLMLLIAHVLEFSLFINEDLDLLVVEMCVTAVVIFVLTPFFLNWMVLKDFRAISRFVEKIRYGELGQSLPVKGQARIAGDDDEINELRRSLNWMARQLQKRDARIKEELDRVEMLNRELRRKSITDNLTGLYNYCYFWEQIGKAFANYKRNERAFCFVIIDIDYFKKINDTYGHPAGDDVLRGVAKILRQQVRDTDVSARIGGEEFGVILHDMDEGGAAPFLNRLQGAIRAAAFPINDGQNVSITVSMGFVSVTRSEASSAEDVVKLADDALYWVKRNGRNNIMNWDQLRKIA